jgi:hypothetical protein
MTDFADQATEMHVEQPSNHSSSKQKSKPGNTSTHEGLDVKNATTRPPSTPSSPNDQPIHSHSSSADVVMSGIDHEGGEAAGAHLNNSDKPIAAPSQHQTTGQIVLQKAKIFYELIR